MKARKLVKDDITRKQNIVFFGSYGYNSKMTSHDMLLYKEIDPSALYISPDLLCNENLYPQSGNSTYYNYFYLNLYFKKEQTDRFITISTTSQTKFTWLLQFNALNNSENVVIQKLGIGQQVATISINDLIDEFGHYDMISNFMIAIMVDSDEPVDDIFTIDYPTRESKLVYDKNKYGPRNPYTYSESQLFNYATNTEGVTYALIPRLSIIKGELWYKMSYGLPVMEKIKSKGIYDSIIAKYITDYPDVTNLEVLASSLGNHTYTYNCIINTVYDKKINLSNE